MKSSTFLLLVLQLSMLSMSLAQITFTREWVQGKRSGDRIPNLRVLMNQDGQALCRRSLVPIIEYLIEMEKAQTGFCGPKPYAVPVFLKKVSPGDDQSFDENFEPHVQKAT